MGIPWLITIQTYNYSWLSNYYPILIHICAISMLQYPIIIGFTWLHDVDLYPNICHI